MGYDVHITRAEQWFESEERPIQVDEWHSYAASDANLSREGPFDSGQHFYNWRVGDTETWLDWFDGAIYTKNPPEDVRASMFEIATRFGARVQGDEGEYYGADGKVVPDDTYDEEGRIRPEARVEPEPWTDSEVRSFIGELEAMRSEGTFEDWLDTFGQALEVFPDEVQRHVRATPEAQARRGRGFGRFFRSRRI